MKLLALTISLVFLLAAPARAGTYEHYTVSPVSPGLDGWSPFARGAFVAAVVGPGDLEGRFWARSRFAPGDVAEWIYTAPADTTVASWEFERAVTGIGSGDWNTLFVAIVDGRGRYVAHDVPSVNRPWGWIRAGGLGASRLLALLQCGGPHVCVPAGTARLAVRSARVVLHDPYAPAVTEVEGDLTGPGPLRRTAALSLAATDRGGGVYRAWPVVDGHPGAPVAIGDARCRDLMPEGDGSPRAASPYQFAFRRPCPSAAGTTVAVDTTALAEGAHTFAVTVEDAAGNAVTAYGPVTRVVDNVPDPRPPAPRPGPRPVEPPRPVTPPRVLVVSGWFRHRALTVTTRYGARLRIRGRVTDTNGRPVAGAGIDVAERVIGPAWQPLTGLRTLPDGTFTAFAGVGPSRLLRLSAAPPPPRSGAAAPGSISGGVPAPLLRMLVRAPVTLQRAGSRLRGRLRGGYVPRGGALIELQARARHRWLARRVVRTDATGRFSARVRAHGPIRARVPRQPRLPFEPGLSPPRTGGRTAARTSR